MGDPYPLPDGTHPEYDPFVRKGKSGARIYTDGEGTPIERSWPAVHPNAGAARAAVERSVRTDMAALGIAEAGVTPPPDPEPEPEPIPGFDNFQLTIANGVGAATWRSGEQMTTYGRRGGDPTMPDWDYATYHGPLPADQRDFGLANLALGSHVTAYMVQADGEGEVLHAFDVPLPPDPNPDPTPPPVPGTVTFLDGHFTNWPDRPAATRDFEGRARNGKPVDLALEHPSVTGDCEVDFGWVMEYYRAAGWPYALSLTMRGINYYGDNDGGGTVDEALSGAYDDAWRAACRQIKSYNPPVPIIARTMHEWNCCYRYGEQTKGQPTKMADALIRHLRILREELPEAERDLCVFFGGTDPNPDQVIDRIVSVDPDLFDILSMDIYGVDNRETTAGDWDSYLIRPFGINWLLAKAQALGKPVAFPETGPNDSDDELFVRNIRALVKSLKSQGRIRYFVQYEDDNEVVDSRLGYWPGQISRPRANEAYRQSV